MPAFLKIPAKNNEVTTYPAISANKKISKTIKTAIAEPSSPVVE
jgi:hypothetical protein